MLSGGYETVSRVRPPSQATSQPPISGAGSSLMSATGPPNVNVVIGPPQSVPPGPPISAPGAGQMASTVLKNGVIQGIEEEVGIIIVIDEITGQKL